MPLEVTLQALQEELAGLNATKSDFMWAAGLAHSRSFATPAQDDTVAHVLAPGVDMCNHSSMPTAQVRSLFCYPFHLVYAHLSLGEGGV